MYDETKTINFKCRRYNWAGGSDGKFAKRSCTSRMFRVNSRNDYLISDEDYISRSAKTGINNCRKNSLWRY